VREVIGRTPIQPALTGARAQIEADVLKEAQSVLDTYGAGVEITQVLLQKVDPPAAVIDSFRDVQRANTDAETVRNQAEAYRNDIVPRAVGESAKLKADADAARQAAIAEARGQTQRFLQVYTAYKAAKDVTMRRMYIETMESVLSHAHAIVVDGNLKGLVPFLPLTTGATIPPGPADTSAKAAGQ
jgi:membrane protease subunit HflK